MQRLVRERRVALPPQRLYAVLADIESYPRFLPGWRSARVVGGRDGDLVVEQALGIGPLRLSFRTRAHLEPPHALTVEALDGPFDLLRIDWRLTDAPGGSDVRLAVQCTPRGRLLRGMVAGSLGMAADLTLDAFERRALAKDPGAPS